MVYLAAKYWCIIMQIGQNEALQSFYEWQLGICNLEIGQET